MDIAIAVVLATALVLIVCLRAHYSGFCAGFDAGVNDGVSGVFADMRDGNVFLRDGVIHVGEGSRISVLGDLGEEVREIEVAGTDAEVL